MAAAARLVTDNAALDTEPGGLASLGQIRRNGPALVAGDEAALRRLLGSKVETASETASMPIGAADALDAAGPPKCVACSFCVARARTVLMTALKSGVGFLLLSLSTTSA